MSELVRRISGGTGSEELLGVAEREVLRARERLVLLEPIVPGRPRQLLVSLPLTQPFEGEYDRWDRSCDICSAYQAKESSLYCGRIAYQDQVDPTITYLVTFGLCRGCALVHVPSEVAQADLFSAVDKALKGVK